MKPPRIGHFVTPRSLSLILASLFVVGLMSFLRAGYATNDDYKIIWSIAGYGEAKPNPFMIYSATPLGLVLSALYAMPGPNWEILLFVAANFLAILTLLYLVLSGPQALPEKILGAAVVLLCDVSFALNITYTAVAAIVSLAGIGLIMDATTNLNNRKLLSIAAGCTLLGIGGAIRIQISILLLAVTLPAMMFIYKSLSIRMLIIATLAAFGVLAAVYGFDRIFVRAHPEWNAYYAYNRLRQAVHDTHRLENLHRQIVRVGWTKNDQELFARWFFPDRSIYSSDRLQYLVDHIPGTSLDLPGTAKSFGAGLFDYRVVPYLLIVTGLWIWTKYHARRRSAAVSISIAAGLCLAENLFLLWAYKDPDYVLWSSLATCALFSVLILRWSTAEPLVSPAWRIRARSVPWVAMYGALLFLATAFGLIISQAVVTSRDNLSQQNAYLHILRDIQKLQSEGKLSHRALIYSPAHGLPVEWSSPFILGFPPATYLEAGWITFAPTYDHILQQFGVESLPDALYQQDNVYLMTESSFTVFLARYYQEHEGIAVQFVPIYAMPNTYNVEGYDDIRLYKVVRLAG